MLQTIDKIRRIGWQALVEKLGVSGTILFILEHEKGYGNYTKERNKMLNGKSLDDILLEIRKFKKSQKDRLLLE
ncbi:hypothetical protein LCGC14_3026990 [marine sediment metagenome]|uniref:Uncharacterized protein n=1 Tax=marine sediment metagenome TaxID=412755 RepID=A0A0F8XGP6_9ZZZZ